MTAWDYLKVAAWIVYAVIAVAVSAAVGLVVSAAQPGAEYLMALLQVFRKAELPARNYVFSPPDGDDPARPNYFYGPARSDLRYVRQIAWSRERGAARFWRQTAGALVVEFDAMFFPVGAGLTLGLVAALPVAVVLAGTIAALHELIMDAVTAVVRSVALALRAVDSARLNAKNITLRCVACFERIPYPAYHCPNPDCDHVHWDIRPGKYGVLRRTCQCGWRMPTSLLLGTHRLHARCPYRTCQHPLDYQPGQAQELTIPLFGTTGAGKTMLLTRMIQMLRAQSSRPGITVDPADDETSGRIDELESALSASSAVPATAPAQPLTYVLRLRIGRQHRILKLIDTAGERFETSADSSGLLYLNTADTFVLVIDPLSRRDLWAALDPAARERIAPYRSAVAYPEQPFQATAQRIDRPGRNVRRLAVVISRADLLGPPYGPEAGDGAAIREWAVEGLGLDPIVRQAEAEFGKVEYFHTGALGPDGNVLETLVHWLMQAEGMAVERNGSRRSVRRAPSPGQPAPATASTARIAWSRWWPSARQGGRPGSRR